MTFFIIHKGQQHAGHGVTQDEPFVAKRIKHHVLFEVQERIWLSIRKMLE